MKLTDYVANFLVEHNITHVFGLTGGAVVHFFDSLDRIESIELVFNHHEQAAALAAVSYARVSNSLGVAIVTTGPGGTNAITGVAAAWQDSIPCLFISGQSRMEHTTHGKPLRQIGSQELDIVSIVRPITKYAAIVESPSMIRYHFEKAFDLAVEGRPGPVWLDIPLDFQWTSINPQTLVSYEKPARLLNGLSTKESAVSCSHLIELIKEARRPLVLVGYGVRLSSSERLLDELIARTGIPCVATWTASDMLPSEREFFVGRPGIAGQRGANLAVQNCDLLICLGSHLSIPLTGTISEAFAREAKIVMVDIDEEEFRHQRIRIDLPVCTDVRSFLEFFLSMIPARLELNLRNWQKKCGLYRTLNLPATSCQTEQNFVDPYIFVADLSERLNGDDIIVVDGGGTNVYVAFQTFKIKEGQRLLLSSGVCAMGSGLPESIGACFAGGGKRTICFVGDGSFQLNIQELQTAFHHNLPIKIFVFNNGGYLAIRHTQDSFLDSRHVGSSLSGGLSLPDFTKVANAYGIPAFKIKNQLEFLHHIDGILQSEGPAVVEVMVSPEQPLIPRQAFLENDDGSYSPRPLEEMFPPLDPCLFSECMIVQPWPRGKSKISK